jgi:hypothetical protein
MSSETLFNRSCLARLPNTNSMASITLDLPLPLGPTTEEKHCGRAGRWEPAREPAAALAQMNAAAGRQGVLALWKGPTRCAPAYDLKFSSTISLITRRGLAPSCVAIAVEWRANSSWQPAG